MTDTKVCWVLQTKLQLKEEIMAWFICISVMNFSTGGSVVENLPANAGDRGSIPGSGSHRAIVTKFTRLATKTTL